MSEFIAGFQVAGDGRFIPTAVSLDTVGVSLARYPVLPNFKQVLQSVSKDLWLMLKRADGDKVYLSEPDSPATDAVLRTPICQESLHIAIELALGMWNDWCPDLRQQEKYRNRLFVPLPSETHFVET